MGNNANVYAYLAEGFPEDRSATAIQTPQRSYSWNDIDELSARYAGLLAALNLPAGARVAVQVEKSPEALMLYLGTLRAGLVYLPLNNAYKAAEVEYFLTDAEPSVVVCDPANAGWMQGLADRLGVANLYTLDADGTGTLAVAASSQPDTFETMTVGAADLAAILYTSGTTGRSKGAMLAHGNLVASISTLHDFWQWRSDDVLLHMLPIFHVHGLFVAAHGALRAGAKMIWLPSLDVDQALHHLPQCTVMMGVPTYYVRLLADARFGKAQCERMRLFISGSAPLLMDTFNAFRERTGHTILERYGMSETSMLTSNPCDPALGPRLGGTVGMPLPGGAVRIMNADDQPLPVGETGYVQVRGANVFSGYWRMPEKTREEFTADGWFRTGDMGRFGGEDIPDNYLTIVGRSKDLIISGGYNVYPKEIELAIDEMSGVSESAVIGVPHADFGEAVVAVVVPRAGAQLDAATMISELKNQLAGFKVPKQIHIVDELPRNTMGKVQKNLLRQSWAEASGA
ncbi:MAG: malonyl-CoA synthase [Burkholderiaceae bacterium]